MIKALKSSIEAKDKEIQDLELQNKELMNILESSRKEQQERVEDDVNITPDELNIAMNNGSNSSFGDGKQQNQILSADIFETENVGIEPLRSFSNPRKKMRKEPVDAENIESKMGLVESTRSYKRKCTMTAKTNFWERWKPKN